MKHENHDLGEKEYLNPQEAILYWNLSAARFHRFLKEGVHPFVAFYRKRKLILRCEFDRFLKENPETREWLMYAAEKRLKA